MYGWRAKIGQLIPSVNTCTEPQMYAMSPQNIAFYSTRLRLLGGSVDEIKKMSEFVEYPAHLLADAQVDLIIFYCTAGSFIGGEKANQEISEKIEKVTGIQSITTATAVVNALKKMELKKLLLITPYSEEINEAEVRFLAETGFEVVGQRGLGLINGNQYAEVEPGRWYRIVREMDDTKADGILFSCTNTRVVEIISALEKDLGKPVITSNQATLWYSLKKLGVKEKIAGFGSLLFT